MLDTSLVYRLLCWIVSATSLEHFEHARRAIEEEAPTGVTRDIVMQLYNAQLAKFNGATEPKKNQTGG